jgi:hypothetical protein
MEFHETSKMSTLRSVFGNLLCWLGFHDFRVLEKTFQFGAGSGIEKVECSRCGVIVTRQT